MTNDPRRFVARYTHDDRAWIVQFREPDIASFGRTLAAAKRHARGALAAHLEVDDLAAAKVEIVDDVRLPSEVARQVDRLSSERARAEQLRATVAESTRAAVANLRRFGFSTRDVGEILGISGTRVAQIGRETESL